VRRTRFIARDAGVAPGQEVVLEARVEALDLDDARRPPTSRVDSPLVERDIELLWRLFSSP